MIECLKKLKILYLWCITLTLIVNLALMTAHFGLANAQQNNTLMQSQGKHGMTTNATNVNIVLVHGTWVD
jgi:hypothetical protein